MITEEQIEGNLDLNSGSAEDVPEDTRVIEECAFEDIVKEIAKNLKPTTFEEAVRPLMQWIAENQHPHASAFVTGGQAELLQGSKCLSTEEYIVD